jgi:hypothetical protein
MHGDFSRWFPKIPKNQVGILAQEGRVLLDADVNAGTLLGMRWQDLAARAAFGAGVAAIPADAIDAWKVVRAELSGQTVKLDLIPGIAWADGLLVELDGTPPRPVTLVATPLQPPIQAPPSNTGAAGTRDAVVLEVWRRALNGYQVPSELIEPALGGPDTAERVETAYALRLYRLGQGETCRSIIGKLRDDLSKRGTLHATLAPTTTTTGDCPVVLGGGYTGFEHDLYRVEIADVDTGAPMFKWSQWNGALCGRGVYDATTKKLTLIAGDQAILRSGLTSFYVEVLVNDTELGHWRVAYGARATLDPSGDIDLSGPKSFGALPSATGSWFIRVWNDLRAVAEFPAGTPTELRDGIRLEFAGSDYVPGDYWTFPVRAGGLDNPSPLLDHAPPHGIHHHRVPLAELHWAAGPLAPNHGIEDCRVPLHPVTTTDGCCTYSVGDGISSHGDFTKIQDAIDALPDTGGRVCVLPGEYTENVVVKYRKNVEIIGCGPRSKLIAPPAPGEFNPSLPAIHVLDTSGIRIEGLHVVAGWAGIGILLEADEGAGTVDPDGVFFTPFLEDVYVLDCLIHASTASGIEVRDGRRVELRNNRVLAVNQAGEWPAITVAATDARIERNHVEVVRDRNEGEYSALGGIWLRGGCMRVDVIDNTVTGGSGHGIMLGHVEEADLTPNFAPAVRIKRGWHGFIFHRLVDLGCIGCGPGDVVVDPPGGGGGGPTWVAGDRLLDISIRGNTIRHMGMSGIGVFGFFFDLGRGIITVENLEIANNVIKFNVTRVRPDLPSEVRLSGYGAISLADAIDLVIRDNEITHNAPATSACAVFVLAGEGIDISGNRIRGNGPVEPQRIPVNLPHGGIWIHSATPPDEETTYAHVPRGRIAVAIRDNEVHAPNGPALVMNTMGHVQVHGNAFTTESTQVARAATVAITSQSLGNALQPSATFGGLKTGAVKAMFAPVRMTVANQPIEDRVLRPEEIAGTRITVRPVRNFAVFLPPPGSILFANNHCVLQAASRATVVFSVALAGLVDMEVSSNHFHTNIPALLPVYVTGSTVRVNDNRFVEAGSLIWSLFAHGVHTNVTGNIASHCIHASGSTSLVKTNNIVINNALCRFFPAFPASFGLATVNEVNG